MAADGTEMDVEWIEETSHVRRRVSHIRSCCAEGCKSKGYRLLVDGERVQYFPFPMYDFDLCNRWAQAVQLEHLVPYEKAFVCSKHFRPSDYKARLHDDSKRVLRRTAIPSLEPVAGLNSSSRTPKKKPAGHYDSSDDSDEDDSFGDMKEITTLVSKKTQEGESLAVLVVKDPDEADTAAELEEVDLPPIVKNKRKLAVICDDLLAAGKSYLWRKQGMEQWVTERMAYHEQYLQKARDSITDETVAAATAQHDCQERTELLSLIIIKKGSGRLTLKNFLRAILD